MSRTRLTQVDWSRVFHYFQQGLAALVQVATILIAYSAFSAVQYYRADVNAGLAQRTTEWLNRLKPAGSVWDDFVETESYLGDEEVSQQMKLERLTTDEAFQVKTRAVLAYFEDLGFVYNKGYVNREFVSHGPAPAIIGYFDDVSFWIDERRRKKPNAQLYVEFQAMATDLRSRPQPGQDAVSER